MAAFTSTEAGPWNVSATWGGGGVPGDGDTATVAHSVEVTANQTVGLGTTGSNSINISGGDLTIAEDITFTVKGDVKSTRDITLEAGATWSFDTATLAVLYHTHGSVNAALYCNGTLAKPCTFQAIGVGAFHTKFPDWEGTGSGRIVAYFTTFRKFGDNANPDGIGYYVDGTDGALYPWIAHDCTFDGGYGIAPLRDITSAHDTRTGRVEFLRCDFINSIVPSPLPNGNWANVTTMSFPGMACSFKHCDFDQMVAYLHPDDWITEDCVLRASCFRRNTDAFTNGAMGVFDRNMVQFATLTGPTFFYGDTIRDCGFVCTNATNNVHFHTVEGGTGVALFERCIWWTTSVAASSEGDGIFPGAPDSGTITQNIVKVKNCIILPNGNGFAAADSHTATAVTWLNTHATASAEIEGCTLFVGNNLGAYNIGETNATVAGNAPYFKSNLVIGHTGLTALKADDLGSTVNDTIPSPDDFNYNGSWRVPSASGGPGNGYDTFPFTVGAPHNLGVNDVDDEDPGFIDPDRTAVTWSGSLAATLNRVSFTDTNYVIADFLDYIREGWRPTNLLFNDAGDPDRGTPQMGAVPFILGPPPPPPSKVPAMQTVSAQQVLGHSSHYHYRLGNHTWPRVAALVDGVDQTYDLGVVLEAPSKNRSSRVPGLVTLDLQASAAFASGESLVVTVTALRPDGTSVIVFVATVSSTELLEAGTLNLLPSASTDLEIMVGDSLQLTTDYTAGGGPAAPVCTVIAQVA